MEILDENADSHETMQHVTEILMGEFKKKTDQLILVGRQNLRTPDSPQAPVWVRAKQCSIISRGLAYTEELSRGPHENLF